MSKQNLSRLVRKYYGYVADLEGSGVETLDLLFVRDGIQEILERSTSEQEIPSSLYGQIHELDNMFWAQRETFLMVIGERELRNARQRQHSSRSHWWWYLDELRMLPQPKNTERDWLTQAMIPA
jgi:hypothetical protein